jgi:uncharacterized sulfatase
MIRKILPLAALVATCAISASAADRPNILWISSEDNGPQLGCYGDPQAITPNLDALAARGLRYLHASSNAPVCAPARTTVISGIYPPASGAEHMRSEVNLPEDFKMFPSYLREAGYFCINPGKTDYNLKQTGEVWDKGKSWKDRAEGQPFFAVFNSTTSHESQIRNEMDDKFRIHDPGKVRVPAYHPDTPEVRRDWGQYYDRITMMDAEFGEILDKLAADGLAEDTIIFYWGDHGSGMPRSKRWPYRSGLEVPLIVHFPENWKHLAPSDYAPGGASERLVGFVDFAPTMLSLVGIEPKPWMQGQAFAGGFATEAPEFSYGFRGRMDERIDLVRSVRDARYTYLRQYMPHRIYGAYLDYMFQTPTTRIWKEMFDAGKLNEEQSHFWQKKPTEELYDLSTDRDEVHNLAGDPAHAETLARFRDAHLSWERRIVDVGMLPEAEVLARSKGSSPYEMARDPERYHFEGVLAAAYLASSQDPADLPDIVAMLDDEDSGVRYWGATGLLIHEAAGTAAGGTALRKALGDTSPNVAIVAAEALGRFGEPADLAPAMEVLIRLANQETGEVTAAIAAIGAIDQIGERAKPWIEEIAALPNKPRKGANRVDGYVGRVLGDILSTWGKKE